MLCIAYQQVAIPIFWRNATRLFDLKAKILLADRAYVCDDWLRFLADLEIGFVVRLPSKCYKKQAKNYGSLQQKARRSKRAVSIPIEWERYRFQLAIKKNPVACPDEPILFWITSLPDAITASELYRKRWKIEICFKCFKTNGFNLQQMNFKSPVKIGY